MVRSILIEPRADLSGARYTDGTKFPEGFDPVDSGMHWIEPNADLIKANLIKANLSKVDLTGAVWNDETVFPEGFEIPDMAQKTIL